MALSRLSAGLARSAARAFPAAPLSAAACSAHSAAKQLAVAPAAHGALCAFQGGASPVASGAFRGFAGSAAARISGSPTDAGSHSPADGGSGGLHPARTPNPPYVPWTATKDLKKRKHYFKRMGFLMQTLEKEYHEKLMKEHESKNIVKPKPGDIVKVEMTTPEADGRRAHFKGICIAIKNRGPRTTFTLRASTTMGGIERTFPLYSPHLTKVEVMGSRRVRRAKLYYLRDKPARESSV